jgi:hypothetical protein
MAWTAPPAPTPPSPSPALPPPGTHGTLAVVAYYANAAQYTATACIQAVKWVFVRWAIEAVPPASPASSVDAYYSVPNCGMVPDHLRQVVSLYDAGNNALAPAAPQPPSGGCPSGMVFDPAAGYCVPTPLANPPPAPAPPPTPAPAPAPPEGGGAAGGGGGGDEIIVLIQTIQQFLTQVSSGGAQTEKGCACAAELSTIATAIGLAAEAIAAVGEKIPGATQPGSGAPDLAQINAALAELAACVCQWLAAIAGSLTSTTIPVLPPPGPPLTLPTFKEYTIADAIADVEAAKQLMPFVTQS